MKHQRFCCREAFGGAFFCAGLAPAAFLLASCTDIDKGVADPGVVVVKPQPYERALRNPLKGFTGGTGEWKTLQMVYIYWCDIEDHETDGIEKIQRVMDERWKDFPGQNIKVIPRVILHWNSDDRKYWPSDMEPDDYTSDQFKERVNRLIGRLGALWDDDPRVAFVEVGIVGQWGEHHKPSPTPEVQELISEAFKKAFPNKLASVRHPWKEFEPGRFGVYWDSFGHQQQMYSQGRRIAEMFEEDPTYWRRNYIGGEVAYDWGDWKIQPGETPADTVRLKVHRDYLINSIRWLHATQLRWVSNYEQHAEPENVEATRAGAELIQKVFGYRFLLEQVSFPSRLERGIPFEVELVVRNEGSAPFYYDWPLELSLLDPDTLEPVWRANFEGVDIRNWLPGSGWPGPTWMPYDKWPDFVGVWPKGKLEYETPAVAYSAKGVFKTEVTDGPYVLAVSILDPAGNVPSVRFATANYLTGGRHPVGVVVVGDGSGGPLPKGFQLDDPFEDRTLHYVFPQESATR